jgi:phosphate starvation-inducible protein PhoH and related proteins
MAKRNKNGNGTNHDVLLDEQKINDKIPSDPLGKKLRIKHKTPKQKDFTKMIDEYEITLCSGPAGCGKSYLSLMKALQLIQTPKNGYDKIYIITPAVDAEESLGAMPGNLDDKLQYFLFSSYYLIDKIIGKENREKLVKDEVIQPLALAFLRGVNIDNAILVFEEAQNASKKQMKTLLTRIGYKAKLIISGDIKQIDRFRNPDDSGLKDVMEKFRGYDKIGIFHFKEGDSVRNPIINDMLRYYDDDE